MEPKANRSPQFLVSDDSLRHRIGEVLEIFWELTSAKAGEYSKRISRLMNPPGRPSHRKTSLGDLYRIRQSEVSSRKAHPIAGKVRELDGIGAFFYEDLVRNSRPADLGSWRSSMKRFDDGSLLKLIEPYVEEAYCRSKAIFIGAELRASGVWRFTKWNSCMLAQLSPQERKMIAPFSKQIYEQAKEILKQSTGVKGGFQMNTKQRRLILAGLALVLLMLLIPPWKSSGGSSKGYHFIFAPPRAATDVDLARLFVQGLFIALLTGGGVFALQDREK